MTYEEKVKEGRRLRELFREFSTNKFYPNKWEEHLIDLADKHDALEDNDE